MRTVPDQRAQRWLLPRRGEPTDAQKATCTGCSGRGECAAAALALGHFDGIWAGVSGRPRATPRSWTRARQLKRKRGHCTRCGRMLPFGRVGLCCECEEDTA
jgi:hypothetical protein